MKNIKVEVVLGMVQKNKITYHVGETFETEADDSILNLDPAVVRIVSEEFEKNEDNTDITEMVEPVQRGKKSTDKSKKDKN